MNLEVIRRYIDYYLPREILGPVIIVFSAENVIDILFSIYVPASREFGGWIVILLISIFIVGWWGEVDEEKDEFEDELEEDGL